MISIKSKNAKYSVIHCIVVLFHRISDWDETTQKAQSRSEVQHTDMNLSMLACAIIPVCCMF